MSIQFYGVEQLVNQRMVHKRCLKGDLYNCRRALEKLENNFLLMPDRELAWKDLFRLVHFTEEDVSFRAINAIVSVFSYMPDKQKAYDDLILLADETCTENIVVDALVSVFPYVPDKQQAWNNLVKLINRNYPYTSNKVLYGLFSIFSYVPDKDNVWNDLHKLTNDEDFLFRREVVSVLPSLYYQVTDKQQAWNDLHKLTNDEDFLFRREVVSVLPSLYYQVTDKQQAWNDLHRLSTDEDSYVRCAVAQTLGSIFSQIQDKQQAWNDLHRLTNDENELTRSHAKHSLGKTSILKASRAEKEEDYKKEIENAIEFFEETAQESTYSWYSPPQFCLPFYRSFHAIVFRKQDAKEEVDKYLQEAKATIEGSKSKELLFEAVNNLAEALKEAQNLENMDLQTMKGELNFYRKYCDRAAELMRETEEEAPYAIAAMRKGLPILDRNLKELLEEIQEKTEVIREQTKGTQFEELGDELSISGQSLLQVRDPVGFKKQVNYMQNTLKVICSKFPEGQKGEACELLKLMYAEPSIEDKIPLMVNILSKFSYQLDMTAHLNRFDGKLDAIGDKLSCISFDVFKLKLNLHNVISNLDTMKKELEKLNEIESLNASLMDKLDTTQTEKLNGLNNDITERLDEIKIIIDTLPKNDDTQKIFDLLNELKQSDSDILLQRSSAIVTLIGFVIPVLSQVMTYNQA